MSTDLQSPPAMPLIEYPIADSAIQELAAEYMPLGIDGIDDKAGAAKIHDARMVVRKKRTEIEKTRKALKADALEYGRQVDAEAKRLVSLLAPVEEHLTDQEAKYKAEKERLKREAAEKRAAELRAWVDKFAAVGAAKTTYEIDATPAEMLDEQLIEATAEHEKRQAEEAEERRRLEAAERAAKERRKLAHDRYRLLVDLGHVVGEIEELADLTGPQFDALLGKAQAAHDERKAREAKEKQEREAEQARIKAEQESIEKQRQAQQAEQQRLDAERQRIEAEKAERERQADRERIEREAAANAKREAEEQAAAEESERQRIEALRPDHEKLLAVADQVAALEVPEVSEEAADVASEVRMLLHTTATHIRKAAGALSVGG